MNERPPRSARFLVVLDADSTLLQDEVIELLAEHAGSHKQVTEITERAMRGEIDFAESLRERVATLAGIPESVFTQVSACVRVTAGAEQLVERVHAAGGRVGVVSGGFHEVLDPVAAILGLDVVRANRLSCREGILTGTVDGVVIDATAKATALREWAAESAVPAGGTIAVGDGANDLEMMTAADLSVAFNAKPLVRDHADLVIHGNDLSQLLPVLGLRG
ncbi:phosphoserine phosphatase SerB [Rathayibacter toxicus]|uniref:phosphoserine phosphatase SerB n=1 Tax=Rathayibacter toxicus TaxID=145458 RepID=UPI001C0574AF|nr:phosphoserine phosphatase SerB [Rathayibacter toxicus]QWL28078.1 phosphoserine phosphatase SerB [Rathayibacter toxicus]QWL30159.1 phosphoserine phosphatase SerB [Rathayibacter toxicus]